jgi:TIGR03943 family protein
MRANLAKSLGGIAACGYVLLLACCGQLGFYIHPRYHLFAAILSTIGIAFLVIDIVLQLKSGVFAHHRFKFHHVKFASCLSVLILLAGYLLPPKPLSPSSVTQRENSIATSQTNYCNIPKPKEGETNVSINRWRSAFNSCQKLSYFDNTSITITGFVSSGTLQNYGYDYFELARYVISCCAADSIPMKILVEKTPANSYRDGTWLIVKGKLMQKIINGKAEYVITESTATAIPQPEDPYELFGL